MFLQTADNTLHSHNTTDYGKYLRDRHLQVFDRPKKKKNHIPNLTEQWHKNI